MEKVIVVMFKSEAEAYEGSRTLGRLDLEGSIVVNAMAVVHKDRDGTLSTRKVSDNGPVGAVTGTVVGALIGALGGPVGSLVGGAVAGLVGGAVDLSNVGVATDFLDEVSQALIPGSTAVIADLIEEWDTPVDTRMAELGGVVLRRDRVDVEADQFEREQAAFDAEIASIKADIATANAERKASLNAKLEELNSKRKAAADRVKAKAEGLRREGEAKIKALQEKANNAKADLKHKQEARIANLRSDYAQRAEKFKAFFE